MKLCLLDRDGVVVVNRPTNIKTAGEIDLIEGAPEAIAALNRAGYKVAVCTNQAEIGRGVLTPEQVSRIHEALVAMLHDRGAEVDRVFCCGSVAKTPFKKPGGGMLRDAMNTFGASPQTTVFVGDQKADLQAAFHARCRGILVRTGMGAKTLAEGLPAYLEPVEVAADLAAAVRKVLAPTCSDPAPS
jgi:D-glycero-D-manno-heptose 1,7-bisphosphate phosphatase